MPSAEGDPGRNPGGWSPQTPPPPPKIGDPGYGGGGGGGRGAPPPQFVQQQPQYAEYDDQWARKGYELSEQMFEYNKAQDELRKKNIQDSMAAIKKQFGGRAGIYGQLRGESLALNKSRLNELGDEATRNLNFSLARSGNIGSSTEIDKNQELAKKMGLGIGQAEIYAQGQADQLRAQDEALKSSLNTLAASGAVKGSQVGAQAKSALSGLRGTASYMRDMDNTFSGLSGQIGAAGQSNVQQQQQTRSPQFGF